MGLSSDVWNRLEGVREQDHTMGKRKFAGAVSALTFAGIVASLVAAQFTRDLTFSSDWTLAAFFLGILVVAIIGSVIGDKSDNPLVSLFGYALVAVPFGLMFGPVFAQYKNADVTKALFITTLLVAVLGVVGALIPQSLQGWRTWLFGGLLALIAGYFIVPITGMLGLDVGGALTWLDWAGVALFSGMVIYDWNKAMRMPRTFDNAIDIARAIFVDWANLLIRILGLVFGRK
jgi:FtsH-binding integral membrane protein